MSIAVNALSRIMPLFHSLGWLGTGQLVGSLVGPDHRWRRRRPFRQLSRAILLPGAISLVAFFRYLVIRAGALHPADDGAPAQFAAIPPVHADAYAGSGAAD